MEVDNRMQLYELQDYDSIPFEPLVRNVKIHEKSFRSGRLQTVLHLIQLMILVILLIAAVAILYHLYTSDSCECSPVPVVCPTDEVLTDIANTGTDTQSAV